jgi:flagellar motility protein MotE (MotC chaperone)
MSQGYDQFFKKAKANKQTNSGSPSQTHIKSNRRVSQAAKGPKPKEQTAEEFLRDAMRMKDQSKAPKRNKFPKLAFTVVVIGFVGAATGFFYPEKVKSIYEKYSFGLFGEAGAATNESQTANPNAENSAGSGPVDPAKSAAGAKEVAKADCPENKGFSEEELSHFNTLNERKKELDLRESELTALEEELHKQKSEVESRIAKLEQIREEVATTLKDRVEVDQQRVSTLVDFYSNMKPKQAADIFAKLNEDLAVEVLGKMKKKNAADILNLLDPAKARVLSEKFTGYKRD